ncbi:7-carboxy-7-deazaguanine synthase QueE [Pseudalkalibacillus caeni]|uniref:7-carboxy-7-deazaguanine synthase n=1 Tax=Exobacillus caeni TaxID=2574798 RepID=A0A5R9F9Q7_9BACL|nr:radical SAM protein [Pseudalkalibacillus caeni]TLS37294.1 radical SAM protein [Pseudalkalibacillus caeni]
MSKWTLPLIESYKSWELPMVEIFETVEGEGTKAGFPTVFVRVFHCNLRCSWCDTPYSYAPEKAEYTASIEEIIEKIKGFNSRNICFTGGEPLIHREKSAALIDAMTQLPHIDDIHIETNGAIDLKPFAELRDNNFLWKKKVRFVMDYKLPDSGEQHRMLHGNFGVLSEGDEIKFVIGSDEDFNIAKEIKETYHEKGQVLFSPVWETMPPRKLVEKILSAGLSDVKLSMQIHKVIWHPDERGV